MEATIARGNMNAQSTLSHLREKASSLAMRADDEGVLKQVISMLGGAKRPCSYTPEEMATNLRQAEDDFHAGRYITHEELCARYGL